MFHILQPNPDTSGGGAAYQYIRSFRYEADAMEWLFNNPSDYHDSWDMGFILTEERER